MHKPQRPAKDSVPPAPTRPDAVQLRVRRSPRLIALGILCVVLGGVAAVALYTSSTDRQSVVAMSADLVRGDVIEREQLAIVELPSTAVGEALPADQIDALVGQRALIDLPEGAFPRLSHVGEDPLPEGQGLVGLKLTLGRLPSTQLVPGTPVRLVSLLEGDTTAVDATVATSPTLLDDGQSFALDVRIADADAAVATRLAATDQLAVFVTGVA